MNLENIKEWKFSVTVRVWIFTGQQVSVLIHKSIVWWQWICEYAKQKKPSDILIGKKKLLRGKNTTLRFLSHLLYEFSIFYLQKSYSFHDYVGWIFPQHILIVKFSIEHSTVSLKAIRGKNNLTVLPILCDYMPHAKREHQREIGTRSEWSEENQPYDYYRS